LGLGSSVVAPQAASAASYWNECSGSTCTIYKCDGGVISIVATYPAPQVQRSDREQ